jgi:CRP/FNR family transcriptional regulator, anaerobic regulatory protein
MLSSNEMEALIDHIKKTVAISDSELVDIVKSFQTKTLNKNSYLIKAGQYCDYYYFVEQGTLRIYTNINDKEITSWFAFKDYFFTELESYNNKSHTVYNIQAIEKSIILYIPRKEMDLFLDKYPEWTEFIKKTWELSFIKLQQIVLSFQSQSAEERYGGLFKYPEFIQKTKQRDLASMLGISKFSLSRLRRKR